jgi:hypothetical protein
MAGVARRLMGGQSRRQHRASKWRLARPKVSCRYATFLDFRWRANRVKSFTWGGVLRRSPGRGSQP